MDPNASGVAKAAPPELVSAAVAALRARLRPPGRLTRALHGLYGDAALQAAHAASEQLGTTMGAAYASLTQELPADYWSDWTPGWGDAASQAASGGLRQLLDNAGVQIKSIVDTRLDDLGNVIASGITAGDGVDKIARDASGLLSDPSRAFMIADTETARAMTAQTMWDYQQAGVGQVEWLAQDDACELCLENEAASPINLGDEWPNGAPPVHPRCRCALTAAVDTGEGT